jgi:uncharacterized protein
VDRIRTLPTYEIQRNSLADYFCIPGAIDADCAIPTTGALLALGMTPGAALAFMVAGAVTSIPAAIAVFALVRRPVFLWYLALALAGSIAAGYGYQGWLAA